jgi:hypothetical protein
MELKSGEISYNRYKKSEAGMGKVEGGKLEEANVSAEEFWSQMNKISNPK